LKDKTFTVVDSMERETITVSTRISKPMLEEIKKVMGNGHLNVSDYLRDLVRKDLKEKGVSA